MITTLASLRQHLQWAIELEHSTIPAYLCALYSLPPGRNQAARECLLSIVVDEMLHMTLSANILNAIGGTPSFDRPDFIPRYPSPMPHRRGIEVSLAGFSRATIECLMALEAPMKPADAPQDDGYETIGQFYEAIREGLVRLCAELGPEHVFIGDPTRQVTDALWYGGSGRIIAVRGLADAQAAMDEIIQEGEGLAHREVWDGESDMFHPERRSVAHYFRLHELIAGRRYRPGDTPASGPTGEPCPVDWDAALPMRTNPRIDDCGEESALRRAMHDFNRAYSSVLHLLEATFSGSPALLAVATGEMYALRGLAIDLLRRPSGDGTATAGPSFEYVPPAMRDQGSRRDGRIRVMRNGPYLVSGDVPLVRMRKIMSSVTQDGKTRHRPVTWQVTEQIPTEPIYALCRCGASESKPFCDGSHARYGFDGTEAADTRATAERRVVVDVGPGMVVRRDMHLCMHAGFCVGHREEVKAMHAERGDADRDAHLAGRIEHCPSGSYTYALTADGPDIEPPLARQIGVLAEERELAGPLWVTGQIPLVRADSQAFETRNRMTLCRCGQSRRKPLCDGTHREIGFRESDTGASRTGEGRAPVTPPSGD